jgi:hypothetical protein
MVLPKGCTEIVGLHGCWAGAADAWLAVIAAMPPAAMMMAAPDSPNSLETLSPKRLRMMPSCLRSCGWTASMG